MGRRKTPNIGKAINGFFSTVNKMAKAAARAEKQRIREQNQRIRQAERAERESMRRIEQLAMAQRRADREYEKEMRRQEREQQRAEREREKVEKLYAKQLAQEQLEAEMSEIESENEEWTTVHTLAGQLMRHFPDVITNSKTLMRQIVCLKTRIRQTTLQKYVLCQKQILCLI